MSHLLQLNFRMHFYTDHEQWIFATHFFFSPYESSIIDYFRVAGLAFWPVEYQSVILANPAALIRAVIRLSHASLFNNTSSFLTDWKLPLLNSNSWCQPLCSGHSIKPGVSEPFHSHPFSMKLLPQTHLPLLTYHSLFKQPLWNCFSVLHIHWDTFVKPLQPLFQNHKHETEYEDNNQKPSGFSGKIKQLP